jgi:hypothetical protein
LLLGDVIIFTPLHCLVIFGSVGCLELPNFKITFPVLTGQGNLPLFAVKLLAKALASGVNAKSFELFFVLFFLFALAIASLIIFSICLSILLFSFCFLIISFLYFDSSFLRVAIIIFC